jgi:biotin carboxyl carrier protein
VAQVPGRVLRLGPPVGSKVVAGEMLLVLEAMKMEVEMKSPQSGVIQSLLVKTGDQVKAGQTLLTLH